ncbi:MAG TPA: Gfo/Idh/MocA family oxidoreductase [Acidimicrobiales bacterium]
MARVLKWGIVGTGGIARTFARDLALTGVGVVSAVGSRTQSSADAFAAEFSIPRSYDSYEQLVADGDVDVVYVATPHPMHYDNATLALEHGKPVLVEKAFTMTSDEAKRLVANAREKQLFLMEAMWTRCLPNIIEVRALIARGELGRILSVEADHGQWFAPDPAFRLFNLALGGGAMLDLGVYPVSFASMVLGTPSRVAALTQPAFTGVDGSVAMAFGYESGAQAVLSCTSGARTPTRASISGTDARIEIPGSFYAPGPFTLVQRNGEQRLFEFESVGRGLHYEAQEVARCIEEGALESPMMPLDETISIMETMEQVLSLT